ncbi:MAG: NAD(+)/NADH kinase [Candidatus Hydrothermarchaeales archaeon]
MKVLIVVKEGQENALDLCKEMEGYLESKGIKTYFDRVTAERLGLKNAMKLEDAGADLILVLGGDGTILWTESKIGGKEIPIFGINFGATGFLTEIGYEDWKEALKRIVKKEYMVEERAKLRVKVNGDVAGDALNEAVVKSSLPVEMLHLEILVDGEVAEVVRSDGIIISTPTGSTAYSMSAGGPIVDPRVDAFIITSICPFKLGARSIVVPGDSDVSVGMVKKKKGAMLVIDGEYRKELSYGDIVSFGFSENKAYFIKLEKDFYGRIKERLRR